VNSYIHFPIRLFGVVLNWLSTGTLIFYLTVTYCKCNIHHFSIMWRFLWCNTYCRCNIHHFSIMWRFLWCNTHCRHAADVAVIFSINLVVQIPTSCSLKEKQFRPYCIACSVVEKLLNINRSLLFRMSYFLALVSIFFLFKPYIFILKKMALRGNNATNLHNAWYVYHATLINLKGSLLNPSRQPVFTYKVRVKLSP
jgi:hypothetical protein